MAGSSSNSVRVPKVEPKQEIKEEKVVDSKVAADGVPDFKGILHSKERVEKFQKYEADYKQYLMTKYFSDKNIFGGNIFDVKTNIDGQTVMASGLPPYQSYLDPKTFDELKSTRPTSSVKTKAGATSVKTETGGTSMKTEAGGTSVKTEAGRASVKTEAGGSSNGMPSTKGN